MTSATPRPARSSARSNPYGKCRLAARSDSLNPRKTTTDVDTSDRLCRASPSSATEPVKRASAISTAPVSPRPIADTATARLACRRCSRSALLLPVLHDMVALPLHRPTGHMLGVLQRLTQQLASVHVIQRVEHEIALSPLTDYAGQSQFGQMLRHGRRLSADDLGQARHRL